MQKRAAERENLLDARSRGAEPLGDFWAACGKGALAGKLISQSCFVYNKFAVETTLVYPRSGRRSASNDIERVETPSMASTIRQPWIANVVPEPNSRRVLGTRGRTTIGGDGTGDRSSSTEYTQPSFAPRANRYIEPLPYRDWVVVGNNRYCANHQELGIHDFSARPLLRKTLPSHPALNRWS